MDRNGVKEMSNTHTTQKRNAFQNTDDALIKRFGVKALTRMIMGFAVAVGVGIFVSSVWFPLTAYSPIVAAGGAFIVVVAVVGFLMIRQKEKGN